MSYKGSNCVVIVCGPSGSIPFSYGIDRIFSDGIDFFLPSFTDESHLVFWCKGDNIQFQFDGEFHFTEMVEFINIFQLINYEK